MNKRRNLKTICLVILSIAILFFISNIVSSKRENNIDFLQSVEQEYGDKSTTIAIFEVDKLPVYIHQDDSTLYVILYDGGIHDGNASIPFDLDANFITDYCWYFDNRYGDRVVWGLCKTDESKDMTVNGKTVKSVKIKYKNKDKNITIEFWYAVLNKKVDYEIKKSDGSVIEGPYSKG